MMSPTLAARPRADLARKLGIGLLALALCGCEKPAPADPAASVVETPAEADPQVQPASAPQGPPPVESVIDWGAAAADRAKSAITDAPVMTQSVGAAASQPAVPVLLPSGIVQAQNARPPALVATADGYFATYQMPKYDAIVNGSKRAFTTGAPAAQAEDAMQFTISEASAQLAFSRYGADYLIEFECRQLDGSETCITEDEAKAFATSLFVAQSR